MGNKHSVLKAIFLSLCACALLTEAASAAMSDLDFMQLCKEGTLEQVNYAIEKGADVNAKDDDGWTPLMFAHCNPTPEVITALIENGADVNAKDKKMRWTPLMIAAWVNPNPEIITVLIENGADVNARDKHGWTPLIFAARANSNPEVTAVLVKNGANVNAQTNSGETPFKVAERNRNPEIITALKNAAASAAKNYAYFIELYGKGTLKQVNDAIKNGADVNARDEKTRWTPLMFAACYNSNPEVIHALIKNGADVNLGSTIDGKSPLHVVVAGDFYARLRITFGASADVYFGDIAVRSDCNPEASVRIAKALIEAGADVNRPDTFGSPPIMTADFSNLELIKLLVESGADLNAKDKRRRTIYSYIEAFRNAHEFSDPSKIEATEEVRNYLESKRLD